MIVVSVGEIDENGIALAVASSGIAAILLDGGITPHDAAFKLLLNI